MSITWWCSSVKGEISITWWYSCVTGEMGITWWYSCVKGEIGITWWYSCVTGEMGITWWYSCVKGEMGEWSCALCTKEHWLCQWRVKRVDGDIHQYCTRHIDVSRQATACDALDLVITILTCVCLTRSSFDLQRYQYLELVFPSLIAVCSLFLCKLHPESVSLSTATWVCFFVNCDLSHWGREKWGTRYWLQCTWALHSEDRLSSDKHVHSDCDLGNVFSLGRGVATCNNK